MTIVGAGAGATILDGGFPLPGRPSRRAASTACSRSTRSAGNVTIRALTLREGYSEDGGGAIQNWSPGLLRLENVHVLDNLAAKDGGGVNNADPFDYQWPTGSLPPTATIPSGRVEIVDSQARRQLGRRAAAPRSTTSATAPSRSPTARSSTTRA